MRLIPHLVKKELDGLAGQTSFQPRFSDLGSLFIGLGQAEVIELNGKRRIIHTWDIGTFSSNWRLALHGHMEILPGGVTRASERPVYQLGQLREFIWEDDGNVRVIFDAGLALFRSILNKGADDGDEEASFVVFCRKEVVVELTDDNWRVRGFEP